MTTTADPWKTGAALALTMTITYTVCALLYALAPARGIDFLNALFHGLDFHKLETSTPFTFLMFAYPLVVFVVWGFAVGTLFAWFRNAFQGVRGRA
ncbi:MAG: DUF5676 family membrane protein [Nitrospirota bacterium]